MRTAGKGQRIPPRSRARLPVPVGSAPCRRQTRMAHCVHVGDEQPGAAVGQVHGEEGGPARDTIAPVVGVRGDAVVLECGGMRGALPPADSGRSGA